MTEPNIPAKLNTKDNKMFVLKSTYDKLQNELDRLQTRFKNIEAEKNSLQSERKNEVEADLESADFEIDFEKIDAFSIERNYNGTRNQTVIGYLRENGSNGEWYFNCSLAQHQKLCEQFNQYKNSSKSA